MPLRAGVSIQLLPWWSRSHQLRHTTQHLSGFHVEEMGSEKRLLGREGSCRDMLDRLGSQHELDDGRCIDNYQRLSRSARTRTVGEILHCDANSHVLHKSKRRNRACTGSGIGISGERNPDCTRLSRVQL